MLAQLGNSVRRILTMALVAMMMVGGLVASPAGVAAQAQTIQSQLTGVTITYGPPYQLQEDGRYADDSMETLMFVGSADVLAMGFMSPLIDINGARDIMLQELFGATGSSVTIDRGDYTGVSYSLDMVNLEGLEMGVFTLFMNQRAHGFSEFYIFIAPPAIFGAAMQTAQNSFTIDGTQLMDGVDATVMGNMVVANVGTTGGTAVTDVTEVTEATDPTPDTGETTTTTTGTDQDARTAYLLEIATEYNAVDTALVNILNEFNKLSEGQTDAQTSRPIMDENNTILAGTNDRIAAIQVPAGMETFHEEVLAWSNAVTNAGATWFAFVEQTATAEDADASLNNAIEVHLNFGDTLEAENAAAATDTGGTTETTDTGNTTETTGTTDTGNSGSQTTRSTDTTQTGTSTSDGDAYLDAVKSHRAEFLASFERFVISYTSLTETSTQQEIDVIRADTEAEAEYWTGFLANAQQLTPPAGYEDVHQAYIVWATEITEAGNLWIEGLYQDSTKLGETIEHFEVLNEADSNLAAAIAAAEQQGSSTGSSSSSSSSETTDTTTTTGSNSSETSGSTSTAGRTTRGSSTPDDTSTEDTDTGSGSSRTTRGSQSSSSGNTSETSGGTDSNASTMTENWYMEVNGVELTWIDTFALSDHADEAPVSDASAGQDRVYLQTTTSDGAVVSMSITVSENGGTDATGWVNRALNEDGYVQDSFGASAEIVDYEVGAEASAILVRTSDDIGDYWVYAQVTCVTSNCDSIALLIIATEGYPLIDTLSEMENGVAVDGVGVSSAIPLSAIEDAVDQFGN